MRNYTKLNLGKCISCSSIDWRADEPWEREWRTKKKNEQSESVSGQTCAYCHSHLSYRNWQTDARDVNIATNHRCKFWISWGLRKMLPIFFIYGNHFSTINDLVADILYSFRSVILRSFGAIQFIMVMFTISHHQPCC